MRVRKQECAEFYNRSHVGHESFESATSNDAYCPTEVDTWEDEMRSSSSAREEYGDFREDYENRPYSPTPTSDNSLPGGDGDHPYTPSPPPTERRARTSRARPKIIAARSLDEQPWTQKGR